jgi:hypothetical protein
MFRLWRGVSLQDMRFCFLRLPQSGSYRLPSYNAAPSAGAVAKQRVIRNGKGRTDWQQEAALYFPQQSQPGRQRDYNIINDKGSSSDHPVLLQRTSVAITDDASSPTLTITKILQELDGPCIKRHAGWKHLRKARRGCMSNLIEMSKQCTAAQARYWAKKAGYRCVKSRGQRNINNKGGFQLVDASNNVVAGVNFDLTSNDVVEFCREELDEPQPDPIGTEYVSQGEWAEMIQAAAAGLKR